MEIKSKIGHNKKSLLKKPVEHIDITSFDSRKIIDSMRKMSFVSRETAKAAEIYNEMLKDKDCSIFLTIAGSTSAAGCMQIYSDLIKYNMVDTIIATGASIIDMDFFEALGFKHYQGSQFQDDTQLRENYIDRIYDTYIDEEQLQTCDKTICDIANKLEPKPYTSREFIREIGKYLKTNAKKKPAAVKIPAVKTKPKTTAKKKPAAVLIQADKTTPNTVGNISGSHIFDTGLASASLSQRTGVPSERCSWDGSGGPLYKMAVDNFLCETACGCSELSLDFDVSGAGLRY